MGSREITPARPNGEAVPATVPPAEIGKTLSQSSTTPCAPPPGCLPEQIGRYRVLGLLGRGGMGVVYLAEDTQLQRQVALKVPSFAADENPAVLERFYREARTAARLQHPNICPVFDVDEVDGTHYLTMAFIEGDTLAKQVPAYAAKPPREAAALVRILALALDEAHRSGIIHRDLKPSNIMMNRRGEPIVMDFGLAREIRHASADLSQPGMVVGTPAYMAPEQARGDVTAIGPGCDVYSLGVVLYQLLIGRVPFEGTTLDVIAKHLRDQPPPPSSLRPGLDGGIEAICLKAMAKEPSQRFLGMTEFAQALAGYIEGRQAAGSPELSTVRDPLEQAIAEMLLLLRRWGWETGIEKIRTRGEQLGETDDPRVQLLFGWIQGAAGRRQVPRELEGVWQMSALAAWLLVGEAYEKNRLHDFARVETLLHEAARVGDPGDNIFHATIAHHRGFLFYQQGQLARSMESLLGALDLCGREHFLTGQLLELIGYVYARNNNFHAARECIEQAIQLKQRFEQDRSVSASYRALGRIYLTWGFLDQAEEAFQQALILSLRCQDSRGQGNSFGYLGRVALAQGKRDLALGRKGAARRCFVRSAERTDASIRIHDEGTDEVVQAYAHRDRALLSLAEGDLDRTESEARQADEVFIKLNHADGVSRVKEIRAGIARGRGDHATADRLLRQAQTHYDRTTQKAKAARVQLEIALNMTASGALSPLITSAFLEALKRAESCRHTELVRIAEEELRAYNEDAYSQHAFQRVRGRSAPTETTSLDEGASEVASVLFLNLQGFGPFCQGLDPGDVMRTLNQIMADLTEVLERHRGFVTSYLGGGFMALIRGHAHAERAIQAALDMMTVVSAFNRPRAVLGLRQLPVRIGISSGSLFLGNIGTYYKLDFTAVGVPVNLAARLMRQGDNQRPCISLETYEMVRDRFEFAASNPRILDLPGLGRREVWDVIGRKG
jgi:class 3 adenylate cyclase/predicted Ser/Thr protein kinase